MNVDLFIAKYGAEWRRLETVCSHGGERLAKLSGPELSEIIRLYLRASAHLTEARSRFHDPDLERYLNLVVSRARQAVYGARPTTARGLARFFGAQYREAIRQTTPFVLTAAGIFFPLAFLVTVWVANSPEARAGMVPADAAEFVSRFALEPAALSTFILVNNVWVAFQAFAYGITLCIGGVYVLVANAVMLGSVAGTFHATGKAGVFWATVLPHGCLELTAICISAGAGLRMGWAIVAPGDRSRTQALADEARGAVLVVLGVIPAFMIAAFIEGFVSASWLPNASEIGIGVAVTVAYVAFLFGLSPRVLLSGRRSHRARRPLTAAPST